MRHRTTLWLLAIFMELGESTSHGAAREALEEAGAVVEVGPLYSLLNMPHAEQAHLFYLAKMHAPEFFAGEESLEVALFMSRRFPGRNWPFRSPNKRWNGFLQIAQLAVLNGEFYVRSRDVLPSERI